MPKIGYFDNKFQKSPNAGAPPPDSLDMTREVQDPIFSVTISIWCRCLAILEQNVWF